MSRLSERLHTAVLHAFSTPVERRRVIAALESVEAEGEGERVRTAVLVLGTRPQADAGAVERYAKVAVIDFRDVLTWAEYSPNQIDYPSALRSLGLAAAD